MGGFVGGAVNAGLNGGNPLVGGMIGASTAGITWGLLGGSERGSLTPALVASHAGVAASNFAPSIGGKEPGCDVCGGSHDAHMEFRTQAIQPGNDHPADGTDNWFDSLLVVLGLKGRIHFDRGQNLERLIHFGKYRFNQLGQLVEHTGRVLGEATGEARKALEYLKKIKPDFFIKGTPMIIIHPCLLEATLCGPPTN